jgi:hypothetical protein
MLCSLLGVRIHLRVVAVYLDQSRDTREEEDLLYDHTLMESALTILPGTLMSTKARPRINLLSAGWLCRPSGLGKSDSQLPGYLLPSDMDHCEAGILSAEIGIVQPSPAVWLCLAEDTPAVQGRFSWAGTKGPRWPQAARWAQCTYIDIHFFSGRRRTSSSISILARF